MEPRDLTFVKEFWVSGGGRDTGYSMAIYSVCTAYQYTFGNPDYLKDVAKNFEPVFRKLLAISCNGRPNAERRFFQFHGS